MHNPLPLSPANSFCIPLTTQSPPLLFIITSGHLKRSFMDNKLSALFHIPYLTVYEHALNNIYPDFLLLCWWNQYLLQLAAYRPHLKVQINTNKLECV